MGYVHFGISITASSFFLSLYRYVLPPPSRPRYNNDNEIETNNIFDDKQSKQWKNQPNGFFVDVPPKFFKGNPAKQQYYQQQYLNNVLKDLYHKSNKYNVIAIKNKYHNVPYYVVSEQFRTFSYIDKITFML